MDTLDDVDIDDDVDTELEVDTLKGKESSTIPALVFIWTLRSLFSYYGKTVFRLGSSTRLFTGIFQRK